MVTGIGGGGHGEQILKALRLGQIAYRVVGTDMSANCANRSRVDHFTTLPPARDPGYLSALARLAKEHGCVAIFHGSEPEMVVLSKARADLEALGFYVPVNPPALLAICQDKAHTFRHLREHGFAVPEFHEIAAKSDLDAIKAFPVILKPSVGGGGSANVFIAQTRDELDMFSEYLLRLYDRFIVQEYVGSPAQEYTVGVLFGGDGKMLNSIAIKRVINNSLTIRTCIPNWSGRSELGDTLVISTGISQGYVADWPHVRRQCEAIAASLSPRAPVNVQCRLVGEAVVPFEINPRFSGTTSLRAMAGYNEPDLLIRRDVLGEKIEERARYREGMILRSLQETQIDS
jgi:carbamoyl-phosphate synthase large subunit